MGIGIVEVLAVIRPMEVNIMYRELLTVPAVARVLGVTESRAYDLIRLGLLPAVKLGRQIRVDPLKLEEFIDNGGKPLPEKRLTFSN